MPAYQRDRTVEERVAILEDQLAALRRTGNLVDDLAMFPSYYLGLVYSDATTLQSAWENTFTPRSSTLTLGAQFFGDQVGTTNTGGSWDIQLNNTTVANGSVPATFTVVAPTITLDLSPYLGVRDLRIVLRTRRTAGATTGGKFGTGGCIASGFLFARMS
jgi:hypothetical protein